MVRIREHESLDARQVLRLLSLILRAKIPLLHADTSLDQRCHWPVLPPQFCIQLSSAAEQDEIVGAKQRVGLNQVREVKPAWPMDEIDVIARSSRRRQLRRVTSDDGVYLHHLRRNHQH